MKSCRRRMLRCAAPAGATGSWRPMRGPPCTARSAPPRRSACPCCALRSVTLGYQAAGLAVGSHNRLQHMQATWGWLHCTPDSLTASSSRCQSPLYGAAEAAAHAQDCLVLPGSKGTRQALTSCISASCALQPGAVYVYGCRNFCSAARNGCRHCSGPGRMQCCSSTPAVHTCDQVYCFPGLRSQEP